jgi:hypothetical protein
VEIDKTRLVVEVNTLSLQNAHEDSDKCTRGFSEIHTYISILFLSAKIMQFVRVRTNPQVGTRRGASVFAAKMQQMRLCRGWRTRHGASLLGECVNPRETSDSRSLVAQLTAFSL